MVVDVRSMPSKKVRCDRCGKKYFYSNLNRVKNLDLMYCDSCWQEILEEGDLNNEF